MENKSLNIHPAAEKIVIQALIHAKKIFSERWMASYALGSLARGGFSEQDSDIDLAIILNDPLLDSDQAHMDALCTQIKLLQPPLSQRLSIFWESIKNIQQGYTDPKARFPAFDCIDFFLHARLLEGQEVRQKPYPAPDTYLLDKEGIQLALDKLNHPKVMHMLAHPESLFSQHDIPPSKIILFPIRLIYTASTNKVGGNDQAVDYYCQNYKDDTVLLVKEAFSWRQKSPNLLDINFEGMKERLILIYKRCISIYIKKMEDILEPKNSDTLLLNQLKTWKTTLENL